MSFTTIFILAPFALIASLIYSYLYIDKNRLKNKIKNKIISISVFILTYISLIVFFTIGLSIIGMQLLVGIIGLPALIILDIVGIILLIRKIIVSIKNKNENKKELN